MKASDSFIMRLTITDDSSAMNFSKEIETSTFLEATNWKMHNIIRSVEMTQLNGWNHPASFILYTIHELGGETPYTNTKKNYWAKNR